MRVHLDTDVGTNPDDVAALAMLLGAPGADLVGVTTTSDPGGLRAALAAHVLARAGRGDVAVTRGATRTTTGRQVPAPRHLPTGVRHRRADGGHGTRTGGRAAARAIAAATRAGAVVVATGPLTNLAALRHADPGALARARVVVSGGWTGPHPADLPQRGADGDTNVALDTAAARSVVAAAGELTFVPLSVTLRVALRQVHLPALRASGPLGRLVAAQAVADGDRRAAALAAVHAGVPDDLLLFLHDVVACAVALGWSSVPTTRTRASLQPAGGGLALRVDPAGRSLRVASGVAADDVVRGWLAAVRSADARRTAR